MKRETSARYSTKGSVESPTTALTLESVNVSPQFQIVRKTQSSTIDELEDFVEVVIAGKTNMQQQKEVDIILYLTSIGLQMKTDPTQKCQQFTQKNKQQTNDPIFVNGRINLQCCTNSLLMRRYSNYKTLNIEQKSN